MTHTRSNWFIRTRQESPQARLLCFPYGGGGASFYRTWQEELGQDIEVCAVQLPGRESRFTETNHIDINTLLPILTDNLANLFDKPIYLFGYSLGAKIAYALVVHCMNKSISVDFRTLICSACSAKQKNSLSSVTLTDEKFLKYISSLGGLPPDIMANVELYNIALRLLRSDFRLSESIDLATMPKIPLPIVAIGGDDDPSVSIAGLEAWGARTSSKFEFKVFPGGHFFFNQNVKHTLDLIKKVTSF